MTSEIRANTLKNRVGLGTVSFTNTGPVVSGIVTATSIEVVGAVGDNAGRIKLPDGMTGSPYTGNLELGNSRDFVMVHDAHHTYITNNTGDLYIGNSAGNFPVYIKGNNAVEVRYASALVLQTTSSGVSFPRDIDVDGHTNLDNVSIAGVSTFTETVKFDKIDDSISMADSLVHTGNNGTKLQFHSNTVELHTSGSQRLQINSAGNFVFKSPNNNTGEQPAMLQWWNENSAGIMGKISLVREAVSQAPGALAFYTSPNVDTSANSGQGDITERLRITSTGLVQIGLTGMTGGDDQALAVNNPAGNANVLELSTGNASGRINFSRTLSNTLNTTSYIEWNEPGAQGTGELRFATSAASNNPTVRLRIDSGGKLWVDRTHASATTGNHPALDLDTYANGTAGATFATGIDFRVAGVHKKRLVVTNENSSAGTGDWIFYRDQGNNEALRINSSGQVRIYNELYLTDGVPLYLGNSNDLSLFHSSNTSVIRYNHTVGGLHFRNNSNADQMIIDSTGALGLGGTPKNNSGTYKQLQIGLGAHFYGRTDDTPIYLLSNGYRDGSNWKYTANTTASQIAMGTRIILSTAASGTAGNNISFTERLRIGNNGKHGINNTNPQYAMHLSPADGQSRIDLHMTNSTTGGTGGDGVQFGYQDSAGAYIWNFENTDIYFGTNNINRLIIETSATTAFNFRPNTNNVCSLGTNSHRWANIHTNDLNLSNEGNSNEVDGTWGQYTIQEGQDDLFLINRRSGKKYKFLLQEVN